MTELWKGIPGWSDLYEASTLGRVRSLGCRVPARVGTAHRKGRVLCAVMKSNGYLAVSLARDGKHFQFHLHRIVAWTFLGPQAPKIQVRHINGNKLDSRPENLAYGSHADNEEDKRRHGTHARGENHGMAKLTNEQRDAIAKSVLRSGILAKKYGVTPDHIGSIRRKYKLRIACANQP